MAYVDPWRYEREYFIAESRDADYVRRKWFLSPTGEKWLSRLADAPRMPDPLRVSAFLPQRAEAEELTASLAPRFADRLCINTLTVPAYDVAIVEATAVRANKWTALLYVAQAARIRPGEIVAFGDDINDVHMLAGAGLGVAMAHAPQPVADAADLVTDSLAALLDQLLAGQLDGLNA